jgi:hypothetical protein
MTKGNGVEPDHFVGGQPNPRRPPGSPPRPPDEGKRRPDHTKEDHRRAAEKGHEA